MHACIPVYMCIHVYAYMYMSVCQYMYAHICMYTCMEVYMCTCMKVCVHVCICMRMCVYMCAHVCFFVDLGPDKRVLGTMLALLIKATMHVCHQEWKINCSLENRSILLK